MQGHVAAAAQRKCSPNHSSKDKALGDPSARASSSKNLLLHPIPTTSDEHSHSRKRRRLCLNLQHVPAHLVVLARPVGAQILARCMTLGARVWSVGPCGSISLEALNSFFNVLSILWGAEAALRISSAIVYNRIPATLASHIRHACKMVASRLVKRGQSVRKKLCVGIGPGKAELMDDAMPEEVWRSNVLFMLKSLEQSVQRLLARSDAASTAQSPATWNLSEHMSASEEASPISAMSGMSEVGEETLHDALDAACSPSLTESLPSCSPSPHGAGIDDMVGQRPTEDDVYRVLPTGADVDKVAGLFGTLEALPHIKDGADTKGRSWIGPPPSSWGQVDSRQSAETANEEHLSAGMPEAPGSLSMIASACEKWDNAALPSHTSRESRAPQAELQWFARSPCFRLSSAQQAARLQAAHSCVVDPPSQEATYGALLSRLPQELRT